VGWSGLSSSIYPPLLTIVLLGNYTKDRVRPVK
jgi:hypothetical protein